MITWQEILWYSLLFLIAIYWVYSYIMKYPWRDKDG
jgi:hypothetical protein